MGVDCNFWQVICETGQTSESELPLKNLKSHCHLYYCELNREIESKHWFVYSGSNYYYYLKQLINMPKATRCAINFHSFL